MQTLTLALPSLTLNGLDPSLSLLRPDGVFEGHKQDDSSNYESYDPSLAERLRILYADFDTQSTRIAELRRDAPGAAARGYVERLEAELKKEDLEKERESKSANVDVESLDTGIRKRPDDMTGMWGKGTTGLVELRKIPGILAKLERAEKAVEVVQGM